MTRGSVACLPIPLTCLDQSSLCSPGLHRRPHSLSRLWSARWWRCGADRRRRRASAWCPPPSGRPGRDSGWWRSPVPAQRDPRAPGRPEGKSDIGVGVCAGFSLHHEATSVVGVLKLAGVQSTFSPLIATAPKSMTTSVKIMFPGPVCFTHLKNPICDPASKSCSGSNLSVPCLGQDTVNRAS